MKTIKELLQEQRKLCANTYATETKDEQYYAILNAPEPDSSQLEPPVKPANGWKDKKLAELKRIQLYFIDRSIKVKYPSGEEGYLVALKEYQNLINLASVDCSDGWREYEQCKRGVMGI